MRCTVNKFRVKTFLRIPYYNHDFVLLIFHVFSSHITARKQFPPHIGRKGTAKKLEIKHGKLKINPTCTKPQPF